VADLEPAQLHAIGVVRSPLTRRADAPRQGDEGAPDATVVLESAYAEALEGIRSETDSSS
jgi:tRNA (Thr-GGU) A37 N-methylase